MVTVTIRGVREHLTIKLDRTADIKRVDIESGLWTLVPVYSVRYTIGEGTITELEVTSFTVVSV